MDNQKYIDSLKGKDRLRILFVCLGNICRSPAAEGVMRRVVEEAGDTERWSIDSAGIGAWHVGQLPDKRMRVHASRRGLELAHRARQVHAVDFDDFDLIVGMDASNIDDLRDIAPSPEAERKIAAMMDFATSPALCDHVPDPYYDGAEGFELVLDLLDDACRGLYRRLG